MIKTRPFKLTDKDIARFWGNVEINGNNCWLWTKSGDKNGYGKMVINRRRQNEQALKAHRISWYIHNGPIPNGLLICHHCDNPPCCNPEHLFLASHAGNAQDMWDKNRHPRPDMKGERNPRAKLTEEDVLAIRSRYAVGGVTHKTLGTVYGVHQSVIQHAITGRYWSHI